jgi:HNH endonuclease
MHNHPFLNQGHLYVWRDGTKRALHRAIMEDHLGRRLTRDEVVHHIDHNPLNNDLSNLRVMTRAEHCVYHLRMMPVTPWTQEEEQTVIRLRKEGRTIDQIALLIRRGYYAVRRRLARFRRLGLL